MRRSIAAIMIALSSPVTADTPPESLEQTYAKICGAGQASDACRALKSAMIEKLTARPTSSTATTIATGPSTNRPVKYGGRLERVSEDSIITYSLLDTDQSSGGHGWRSICFDLTSNIGTAIRVTLEGSTKLAVGRSYDCHLFETDDNQGMSVDWVFTPTDDHPYLIVNGKRDNTFAVKFHRPDQAEIAQWKADTRTRMAARRQSGSGGGLLGVMRGALAGAAGMAGGGGGMDAAIAGAAAGAVAGAAGVEASSIQSGFQQGAGEINAQNAAMQAKFEQGVARAGAPGYQSALSGEDSSAQVSGEAASKDKAATAPTSAGEVLSKRAVNVYFWVSTVPTEQDDHNTHCASNVFPITIDWNERGWGNGERAAAALDPMMATFLAKCQRLKPITSAASATYHVEGLSSYGPLTFRKGDTQVTMP